MRDLGLPLVSVTSVDTDQSHRTDHALPIAAWEFSLGVSLLVKGFKPSPITAGMTAANTRPAYTDAAV